jgi:hypothetical protein
MPCIFAFKKKEVIKKINYANLAINAKNVFIGELENKIDIVKVIRDKNEKESCKKIAEELSKQLLILKNDMYVIREQKEDILNILERIKNHQEKIDFYKADQYYSYRANVVVLENYKGETTKGSKVIVELASAVEKKEFKKFGLFKEKLAENEKCYLVVFNNFNNNLNDLFFKFESILIIEYASNSENIKSNINKQLIYKFSLIELLISNLI